MCVPWHFAVGIRVTFYSPWNAIRKRSPNPSSLAALAWAVIGNSMGFLILRHLDEPLSINEIQIKCWSPKWDGNVPLSFNNHGSGTGQGPLKNDLLVGARSKFNSCMLDSGCLPASGNPMPHNNTKLKNATQQHTTSLTASQVFDVWPSEKSEAPASYYYLSKTWIQEPSRWGLRELSACCAPTASGAHFEGCNVSFRSYSRVWISMEPLSWKDQPGRCCY